MMFGHSYGASLEYRFDRWYRVGTRSYHLSIPKRIKLGVPRDLWSIQVGKHVWYWG